jgi:hypothetical protein
MGRRTRRAKATLRRLLTCVNFSQRALGDSFSVFRSLGGFSYQKGLVESCQGQRRREEEGEEDTARATGALIAWKTERLLPGSRKPIPSRRFGAGEPR